MILQKPRFELGLNPGFSVFASQAANGESRGAPATRSFRSVAVLGARRAGTLAAAGWPGSQAVPRRSGPRADLAGGLVPGRRHFRGMQQRGIHGFEVMDIDRD